MSDLTPAEAADWLDVNWPDAIAQGEDHGRRLRILISYARATTPDDGDRGRELAWLDVRWPHLTEPQRTLLGAVAEAVEEAEDAGGGPVDVARAALRVALAATPPAPEGEAVRSWWVGWYGVGEFEYHGPWWVSGAEIGGAGRSTFVAAVRAADEAGARQVIAGAHDEPDPVIEWRFVEERPESWDPFGSDRFPRGDWMQWPAPAGPQAEGADETEGGQP